MILRGLTTLGEGGLRCPVCDFTSHDFIRICKDENMFSADEVKKHHPNWDPSQGLCPQCFKLYSFENKVGVLKNEKH